MRNKTKALCDKLIKNGNFFMVDQFGNIQDVAENLEYLISRLNASTEACAREKALKIWEKMILEKEDIGIWLESADLSKKYRPIFPPKMSNILIKHYNMKIDDIKVRHDAYLLQLKYSLGGCSGETVLFLEKRIKELLECQKEAN